MPYAGPYPWDVAGHHRRLVERYARLKRLDGGITPQERGRQLNKLLGDLLRGYGIEPRVAQPGALGEIDVSFVLGGHRFIVEAKWCAEKIDYNAVNLLATHVRQRLDGTLGIFVSVSGYTPNALEQLCMSREPLRILLFDGGHLEALISGLTSPGELISAAVEEASATGRQYLGALDLLQVHSSPSTPPVVFADSPVDRDDLPGTHPRQTPARVAVSTQAEMHGLCSRADGRVLVALTEGITSINLAQQSAEWLTRIRRPDRDPLEDAEGSVFFFRGAAVVRLSEGRLSIVAGGYGPAAKLFRGPESRPWIMDTTRDSVTDYETPAALVELGLEMGTERNHHLTNFPAAYIRGVHHLADNLFCILGADYYSLVTISAEVTEKRSPMNVLNAVGISRLHDGRLVIAGGFQELTIVELDPWTGGMHPLYASKAFPGCQSVTPYGDGALIFLGMSQFSGGLRYLLIDVQGLNHEAAG